jgi:hypothetical protein
VDAGLAKQLVGSGGASRQNVDDTERASESAVSFGIRPGDDQFDLPSDTTTSSKSLDEIERQLAHPVRLAPGEMCPSGAHPLERNLEQRRPACESSES